MDARCRRLGGDDWDRFDEVLTTPGWFSLEKVVLVIEVNGYCDRTDEMELALQELREAQFPRLSSSKTILFHFDVIPSYFWEGPVCTSSYTKINRNVQSCKYMFQQFLWTRFLSGIFFFLVQVQSMAQNWKYWTSASLFIVKHSASLRANFTCSTTYILAFWKCLTGLAPEQPCGWST